VEETTRLCVSGEWILRTLNRTTRLSAAQLSAQAIPTISSMPGFCPIPLTCEWVAFPELFRVLPSSLRITAAADGRIRISDISVASNNGEQDSLESNYTIKQSVKQVLRCHDDRVKRILTEDSPALFLSVSEVCTTRMKYQCSDLNFGHRTEPFANMI